MYRNIILKGIVLMAIISSLTMVSTSCRYKEPRFTTKKSIPQSAKDSLKYLYTYHFTLGTNMECTSDSVNLVQLPIIDDFKKVEVGDNVVVADFMIQPKDTVDSVWVKVARDQETMGWIHENQIMKNFMPVSSISQFIYLFSHTHASLLLLLICLLAMASLYGRWHTGRLKTVFFDDIDSAYPLLMCFCMAMSATIYESMQMFLPDTWEHFYFNPTVNPLKVPLILSIFLLNLWGFIIVMIAALEDTMRMLKFTDAIFYIIGLFSACIFCYFFFIYTTRIYIGYAFMLYFFYLLIRKAIHRRYHYQCGNCGAMLKEKGKCPKCGAINE
jgi:hypothetical protein